MTSMFVFIWLLVTIIESSSNVRKYKFSMPRILLLIVLVWILYLIVKRVSVNLTKDKFAQKKDGNEKMVLCSKCGCHIPKSESLITNNQVICNNPDCNKPE
jgi:uncharacterized protein